MPNDKEKEKEKERPVYNPLDDLQELQFRIKQQGAEHYIKEVRETVNEFKTEFDVVKGAPAAVNNRFIELSGFFANVSEHYKTSLEFFPIFLQELLENFAEIMNPKLRLKIVQSLITLRNKNLILPIKSLTVLFKLFRVQDKSLRKLLNAHILNDIKRMNKHHKNQNLNKQIQNFIFEILKNNHDNLAKRSLLISIQLYKKNIWNDAKVINIIASGCFNDYYKINLISCYFLIETTILREYESSDDEEANDFKVREQKASKKTKSKEARLERERKKAAKRERQRAQENVNKNFFPIDMIYSPQDFCEKLFAKLKKFNGKFEVKCSIMAVLARMIGRHKLILFNFYSFLLKYLFPAQRDVAKLLAFLAESVHDLVPPEELKTVLKHIVDQFVGEHVQEVNITMGLNLIRELSYKQPLVMDEDTLHYVSDFTEYKERNVSQAAKSVVNLFRELNPKMLSKKHRGRLNLNKEDNELESYGVEKVYKAIPGAELLPNSNPDIPIYMDRILDDKDFKMIKKLQRKKMEEEHLEKQRELERLRDVRSKVSDSEMDEEIEDEEEDELIDVEEDSDVAEQEELDDEEFEEIDDEDDEFEEIEDDIKQEENEVKEQQGKSSKKLKSENKKRVKFIEEMENYSDDDDEDDDISEEDSNPHGFVFESDIGKYRKTKSQQKQELREAKLNGTLQKDKPHTAPKQKGGGTTNKQKNKNKPLAMLRPKKNKEKVGTKQVDHIKHRIKSLKNQIGHVRSVKQAKKKKLRKLK